MKAEYVGKTDYRRKRNLCFWPLEKRYYEDWELWEFHHALSMALKVMD